MNDKMGSDGLVPSPLLFGELPSIAVVVEYGRSLKYEEIGTIFESTRSEMRTDHGKMRVRRALKLNVPDATDKKYHPGDDVLV